MSTEQTTKKAALPEKSVQAFRGHINFALSVFEKMDDKTLRKVFTHDGKTPPTVKTIRSELKRYRDAGLKFFPPCDNFDAEGKCKGH